TKSSIKVKPSFRLTLFEYSYSTKVKNLFIKINYNTN
ncbi:unnamed protein product, partial [marine sediment metagenome]